MLNGTEDELTRLLNQPPEPERPYVYVGTRCHINKFGILNPEALDRVIRCTTGLRAAMMRSNPIAGEFDLPHLRAIHRYLFQDVYDWAGEIRTIDFTAHTIPTANKFDPSDDFVPLPDDLDHARWFLPQKDIVAECERLLGELRRENWLRGLDREQFIDRGVCYLLELFRIHPFRDGNGRTIRAFLAQLGLAAGWRLEFDGVSQVRRHFSAYQANCGDFTELRAVFSLWVQGEATDE